MSVEHLTDQNFEKFLAENDGPVLVDFWAPWCGPCRMLGPVIEQLAQENQGKLKVVKVNVDESMKTAMKYGIQGIPTVKILKKGQEIFTASGAYPKEFWQQAIDKVA